MSPGPTVVAKPEVVDVEEVDVSLPAKAAREVPYNPEPNRDRVRGWLALALVVLLVAVIVAAWVTLWAGAVSEPEIKDLLGVLLPPVVALVGSALGFYFGGKSTGK
jgi:heme A synthase